MITKRQLFIQMGCLLLLFLTAPCHTMFRRIHTNHRPEHVRALQAIQQINSIAEIDGTIKEMKDKAYDDCLQELHKITNIPVPVLKKQTDTHRKLARNLLAEKNFNATHDPNLPASFYHMLRKTYDDEGLTLDSTKVKFKKTASSPHILAETSGGIFYRNYLVVTPKLTIYDLLKTRPENQQLFTLAHEREHHLLQHLSMRHIAVNNSLPTNIQNLASLQEIEADIAASKNSTLACAGASMQCSGADPNIINSKQHCEQLQRLCALNLRKEELAKQLA